MNVFNEHPFKVLMDYGHNAHAVGVMADLAQRLDVAGRRIVVLAGPGDRRDEDLRAIADAVAGKFDHYICRRDDALRGRDGDEVPRIIANALQAGGVAEAAISIIPDEQQAIDAALRMGQPGDLVLVFADALTRSWKQIIKFQPEGDVPQAASRGSRRRSLEPVLDEALYAVDGRRGARRTRAALRTRSERLSARRPMQAIDVERTCLRGIAPADRQQPVFRRQRRRAGNAARHCRSTRRCCRHGAHASAACAPRSAGRDAAVVVRRHASGASLAFAAPIDQLYTAAEANEWAWLASLHAVAAGDRPAAAGMRPGHAAAWDEASALQTLRAMAAEEANPALVALLDAARRARRAGASRRRRAVARRRQRQPQLADPRIAGVRRRAVDRTARHPAGGGHRLQRQDHHRAPAGGDGARAGMEHRLQQHRRLVRRRRARRQRRLLRAGRCAHGIAPADVDAAILETARGGLLRRGIAIRNARAAVVTNISPDHFGEYGIHDLDDLAEVKLTVAPALAPDGVLVLNADDPLLLRRGRDAGSRASAGSRSTTRIRNCRRTATKAA